MTMHESNLPEFERLLEDRRSHCARLLELSRRQRDLIASGDYTTLLSVLGQKQQILAGLDVHKTRQPALIAFWQRQRNILPAEDRQRCEALLAEVDRVLALLVGEEEASSASLVRQRDATRSELEQLNRGSEVHRAYRDPLGATTHRHLDVGG
jgi:hypothetical protein